MARAPAFVADLVVLGCWEGMEEGLAGALCKKTGLVKYSDILHKWIEDKPVLCAK